MFDVVIVGGGAAGCVLAARLADGGERSVALVEAGPDLRAATPPAWREGWRLPAAATLPDWELDAEPDQAGTVNRLRRGRVLGGTSWLTRFAVRGAAADFDRWAAHGNPGWAFVDVLPAFRRLETDLEFGDAPWHGGRGPIPITRYPDLAATPIHEAAVEALVAAGTPVVDDHNRPDAVGVGRLPMSTRGGRRITALDGYLDPVPPSVEVRPDAPVVRVVLEGHRAIGVELADGSVIPAGWVVLSAGTYGSPAILLRSGIGPAAHLRAVGIDAFVDLAGVGENLADHLGVDLDVGWSGPATEGHVLHAIATSRSAITGPAAPPDVMLWISDPLGNDARFALDPILLKPESRGTVRLRSADPLAAPRITLPGIRTDHDLQRLIDAYRANLALANAPGIRALASEPAPPEPTSGAAWREHVIANSYSLPHVVGTCAMGPDPTAGAVVDARARVHGVERLSVVDASVIPEPPSGFPHLITIMLAEHLAAMAGTGW